MNNYQDKAQRAHNRIIQLSERLQKLRTKADSKAWPYTSLTPAVRLYVRSVAEQANALIIRASQSICVNVVDADGSVQKAQEERFDSRVAYLAREQHTSVEAVEEVSFALCMLLIGTVTAWTDTAEAVIEGDQTIDGRTITHGPLYDK